MAKEFKRGFISPEGEVVIVPTFDGTSYFSEGLAAVLMAV
ncbi:MAG: WG repeat-containing protein [Muribaculaceae bacterium]|nr:WG repeat-containing protein [Muribaculaceae bacterium]MDE6642523.1 WG repeat-containing protein [Muribaculaceae bacterium]